MEQKYIKLKQISNMILLISSIVFLICLAISVICSFIETEAPDIIYEIASLSICGFIVVICLKVYISQKLKPKQISELKPYFEDKPDKNSLDFTVRNSLNKYYRDKRVYVDFYKLNIHEDIKDLIFHTDYKPFNNLNYKYVSTDVSYINKYDSFIEYNPNLEIAKLPYNPSYPGMSELQKGKYLKFLENPYDGSYEIGYVFVLFYNLEHHLIFGNKDKAAHVINKLRQYHNNGSFQGYSFDALAYFFKQRGELFKFLEYEYDNLDFDYSIFYHYSTDTIYPANFIIKNRTKFGLKKDAYIKREPVLFQYELNNQLAKKYDVLGVPLYSYFPHPTDLTPNSGFPANISLKNISNIQNNSYRNSLNAMFINDVSVILNQTYDIVSESYKQKSKS